MTKIRSLVDAKRAEQQHELHALVRLMAQGRPLTPAQTQWIADQIAAGQTSEPAIEAAVGVLKRFASKAEAIAKAIVKDRVQRPKVEEARRRIPQLERELADLRALAMLGSGLGTSTAPLTAIVQEQPELFADFIGNGAPDPKRIDQHVQQLANALDGRRGKAN